MVDNVQGNSGGSATAFCNRMALSKGKVVSDMNVADRIQSLRKTKGISQEELADKIGVSRQAVSKWESEQSLPDIEKIIALSEYFEVTTDYLLKGIERKEEILPQSLMKEKPDARIFAVTGTVFNFIGLVTAIFVWVEEQSPVSCAIGLILMAMGCMIFAIGQFIGENKKNAWKLFGMVSVWFLTLIPFSCAFNVIEEIRFRYITGLSWVLTPLPRLSASRIGYVSFWLVYFSVCILTDIWFLRKKRKE